LLAFAFANAAAARSAEVRVTALDLAFDPPTITVTVGDTVTWVMASTNRGPHDVTARDGTFVSPRRMELGQTYSWTATAPGTYEYVCTPHERAGMVGRVIVQGGAAPGAVPRAGGGGLAGGPAPRLSLGLLSVVLGAVAGLAAGRRPRAWRGRAGDQPPAA
jgi:plastocyanin